MNLGKSQDPERAKTIVISFKTVVGAVAEAHMQTFKIIGFGDVDIDRLRVDTTATTEGKHDPSKQDRKSILIYKSHVYTEASLDPERWSFKTDVKFKNKWVSDHVRQIA